MLLDLIKNTQHTEQKIFDQIKTSSSPVVLFGAGELALYNLTYLRQYLIEPVCICDNNPTKQGSVYLGLPVCSYDKLKATLGSSIDRYNIIVSVGPQYKNEIFSQMKEAYEKNPVWYLRGYEVCGEKINYSYFQSHSTLFEEAYNSLADDFSKKVFVNVLNAKLSGDFSLYEEIISTTEYFDPDIVQLSDNEVLLDVGAYKGYTIVEFCKRTCKKYERIIACEPDITTLAILNDTVEKNDIQRIEIHNKGAWNKTETLYFHDGLAGSSRISEARDITSPTTSINVDTIDNILDGRRVTYLSMDIEGAEHNAILGAEQTIKKWKPTLAVCVYHKREDLFDLLLLIKSFVPQYKFYMRHYTDNQTETVLYAVLDDIS